MEVVTQFCQTRSNVTLKYLGWKFDFIDQSSVDGKQSVAHFKTFGVRELSSVKHKNTIYVTNLMIVLRSYRV